MVDITCYICERVDKEEDFNYCIDCDQYVCESCCYDHCVVCTDEQCDECIIQCTECNKMTCQYCVEYCCDN